MYKTLCWSCQYSWSATADFWFLGNTARHRNRCVRRHLSLLNLLKARHMAAIMHAPFWIYFLQYCILIRILLEFLPLCPIDNKPALTQIMACHLDEVKVCIDSKRFLLTRKVIYAALILHTDCLVLPFLIASARLVLTFGSRLFNLGNNLYYGHENFILKMLPSTLEYIIGANRLDYRF